MRLVDHVRVTPCEKSKIPAHVSAETGIYSLHRSGKHVAFQSSLERSFVQLCDFANEVHDIRWEPFTLLYDDLVDEQERRYTPDYLVETTTEIGDRYTYIVEVKPEAEIDRIWHRDPYGVDARRHVAMMAWCKEQGATQFVLVSERLLADKGLPNMLAITDRASSEVPEEVRLHQLNVIDEFEAATLGDFVAQGAAIKLSRGRIISSLFRLCADDELWFDIGVAISDSTVFRRGARRRVFLC
jgi:hypothetical protein